MLERITIYVVIEYLIFIIPKHYALLFNVVFIVLFTDIIFAIIAIYIDVLFI